MERSSYYKVSLRLLAGTSLRKLTRSNHPTDHKDHIHPDISIILAYVTGFARTDTNIAL